MAPPAAKLHAGTTLVETMVATALVVGFFVSMFELDGVCLRYINSAKNSIAALQGLQDRMEQLRNLQFSDLTNPASASFQSVMGAPANGSDFLKTVTEVVRLSRYPTPDGSDTVVTLPAGASAPTTNSTDSSLGTDNPPNNPGLVKVNVTYTWTTALGGRAGTEQAETIIGAGIKK